MTASLITTAACSSSNSITTIPQAKQSDVIDVPEWYLHPPKSDTNNILSVGTERSQDLQFAVDKATLAARMGVASQVKADIASLQNSFKEEAGSQADPKLEQFFAQVGEQFASESLRGSSVVEQKIFREGIFYRAYVLVKYPLGQANSELWNKIKNNDYISSKQSAEQALEKLDQRRKENLQ